MMKAAHCGTTTAARRSIRLVFGAISLLAVGACSNPMDPVGQDGGIEASRDLFGGEPTHLAERPPFAPKEWGVSIYSEREMRLH